MQKQILLLSILGMLSCSKSDDNTVSNEPSFQGTLSDIEEYYTPELVESLQNLGFIFNLGNTPGNVEGVYEISPSVIQASTTGIDNIGERLADQTITLSNQNNDRLTIDFKIDGNGQTSFGNGSFISGDSDEFSIFIKSQTQNQNSIAVETATSITGKVSQNGLLNFQFAGLMLDDKGDPDGVYIENNTGRLIHDSDKTSPRINLTDEQVSKDREGTYSSHLY